MTVKGIGIDLVDIAPFRERLSEELAEELFLEEEARYCRSQARYWENFAARFAAKEAAMKALGQGLSSGIRFRDIEVARDPDSGCVSLVLHGRAREAAARQGIGSMTVSISHTRISAVAMVIALGTEKV